MDGLNRRYFDSLMAGKKMSLRALAQRMGLSHSQLSLTFSGARKLQLDEAAQLSNIFGEPLHRIVENAGVSVHPSSGRRIAVVGVVRGDGTVEMHDASVIERTNAPEDLPADAVAIQCRTSGTPLEWLDGWVFYCRDPQEVEPGCLGRFSLCKIKDGLFVVGTVKRGYQDGTFNLLGTFARENVTLEAATPILFTRN